MVEFSLPLCIYCGVDEAGRGPLAGPVVAAAVILDPAQPIGGLADSKKLSAQRRAQLYDVICRQARAWHIAQATVEEIDQLNILQATLLAMQRAVAGLSLVPEMALIDGNRCPDLTMPAQAIIKGDDKVEAISAASILAKVYRDRLLHQLDRVFPQYGFANHSGYPTAEHKAALNAYGASPHHRRSFAPVKAVLAKQFTAAGQSDLLALDPFSPKSIARTVFVRTDQLELQFD
ncbi:MAG: ribonuclease HII [Ottowia sp.]|nr:ribonuclease HII [Ottowia sp.]